MEGEDADGVVGYVCGKRECGVGESADGRAVETEDGGVDVGEDGPEVGLFVAADGRVGLHRFLGGEAGRGDEGEAGGEVEELADGDGDGGFGGVVEVFGEELEEADQALRAWLNALPGWELVDGVTAARGVKLIADWLRTITSGRFPGFDNTAEDLVGGGMAVENGSFDRLDPLVTASILGGGVRKEDEKPARALAESMRNHNRIRSGWRNVSPECGLDLTGEWTQSGGVEHHQLGQRAGHGLNHAGRG